jgi:hypothetical protein
VIARAVLERDVVILACAISAGIHAALVPSHLEEGNAAAAGFAASAVLLGVLAATVTRSSSPLLFAAAAAVFTGLIASYALAVTTGIPLLHPHREAVEGLAVFTKAVELVGLLAAVELLPRPHLVTPQPKGITT